MSTLVHEGDASFPDAHLLLAHTVSVTLVVTVTDGRRTLSSKLVHEGDASFLAGHLLLTCFTLTGQFL